MVLRYAPEGGEGGVKKLLEGVIPPGGKSNHTIGHHPTFERHPVFVPEHLEHPTELMRRRHGRRLREEAEGSIKLGTRRRKTEDREHEARARNPLRGGIDLRDPGTPNSRPVNFAGETSFHFGLTSVNSVSASAADGGVIAIRQEKYISGLLEHDPGSAAGQERYVAPAGEGDPAASDTRVEYCRSNIANTVEARVEFWTQAQASARKTGLPTLELHPERGELDDFQAIVEDPTAPDIVRDAAREIVAEMVRSDVPSSSPERSKPIEIILLSTEDQVWAKAAGRRCEKGRDERMLHFRTPRSTIIQQRLEAELPRELSAEGRRAVVDAFAADLDRVGVRYTIVIHRPEPRNDPRNFHIHILYWPGRCHQLADGRWHFRARGEKRKLRPGDIQSVLAEEPLVAGAGINHTMLAEADIASLRARFAKCCNDELAWIGFPRRFNPDNYEKMGIDQEPGDHLGSRRASLAAAGVTVELDRANAWKAWDAERRRMTVRHSNTRLFAQLELDMFAASIRLVTLPDRKALERLHDDYVDARNKSHDVTVRLETFELEERIARSGAERLERNMLAWIAQAKEARATPARIRDLPLAEGRLLHARRHLAEIDRDLEPHAETLAAGRQFEQDQMARAAELQREIKQLLATAEQVAEKARRGGRQQPAGAQPSPSVSTIDPWSNETILPGTLYPERLDPIAHFDALIAHIRTSTPVVPVRKDGQSYSVPGLKVADRHMLHTPALQARVQPAFAMLHGRQMQAIDRLIRFVHEHGKIFLAAGIRRDAQEAQKAIQTLYARYKSHPVFLAKLEAADEVYREMCAAEHPKKADAVSRSPAAANLAPALPLATPATPVAGKPIVTSLDAERVSDSSTPAPVAPSVTTPIVARPVSPNMPIGQPISPKVATVDQPLAAPTKRSEGASMATPVEAGPSAEIGSEAGQAARSTAAPRAPQRVPAPPTEQAERPAVPAEEKPAEAVPALPAKVQKPGSSVAIVRAAIRERQLATESKADDVAASQAAQPDKAAAANSTPVSKREPPSPSPRRTEPQNPVPPKRLAAAQPSTTSLPPRRTAIERAREQLRDHELYRAMRLDEREAFDLRVDNLAGFLEHSRLDLGFDDQKQLRSRSDDNWVHECVGQLAESEIGWQWLMLVARALEAYPRRAGPWDPRPWAPAEGIEPTVIARHSQRDG